MTNKTLAFLKKYVWLITTIIAVGGFSLSIYEARVSTKNPALKYYVVKVSPEINDLDLQATRQKIENSLFQSVGSLMEQNSRLTYSEALDRVLPISEAIGKLSGGVVVVIQNQGEITAKNLHVNITLETPIEKYQILSNETSSIIDFDKESGVLKFSVDRLTPNDTIQIAIIFPGSYAVSVTASRANNVVQVQPTPSGTLEQIVAATQVAVASPEQNTGNSLNGFLQFYTESKLDNVQTNVFVSSDEVQGEATQPPKDTTEEKQLFFRVFQP